MTAPVAADLLRRQHHDPAQGQDQGATFSLTPPPEIRGRGHYQAKRLLIHWHLT